MKSFHRNSLTTASITDIKDGTAQLIIVNASGKKVHDKIHKNRNAAMAAWYRFNR